MAIPCEMLLHPELLTNEQLIHIIQERHLRVQNIQSMARHELLDLFHQFCVPYGQRKYRDSGRGKILNKVRSASPEPIVKLNTFNTHSQIRKLSQTMSERLKPPPDLLSGHLKRIKLETKPLAAFNDVNSNKRKISIEAASLASDSPPSKKERKPISWP